MERIENDNAIKYQLTEKEKKRKSFKKRLFIKSTFYLGVSIFFCLPFLVARHYEFIPYVFFGSLFLFLPNFYFDYQEESKQIIEVDLPKDSTIVNFKVLDKEKLYATEFQLSETKLGLFKINSGPIGQAIQRVMIESKNRVINQEKSFFWPKKLLEELFNDIERVKSKNLNNGLES